VLGEETLTNSQKFDCNHEDLNSFFYDDCINYSKELLGKSYCFTLDDDPKKIVCAFTVSNDSVKVNDLPGSRKKKVIEHIPHSKHFKSYPAVLIGRLGVNKEFKRKGIGTELMDFIKSWFIHEHNKTGCRFLVVDSYNDAEPMNYYKKCGFETLFSTEYQEIEYTESNPSEKLKTRFMFFDLILLYSKSSSTSI